MEKTVMMTGKQYTQIRDSLEANAAYTYNAGSEHHPVMIEIMGIYLDTDPDFTRNPKQFARISDDMKVQVKIEYDE